jgi:hypothetical protein
MHYPFFLSVDPHIEFRRCRYRLTERLGYDRRPAFGDLRPLMEVIMKKITAILASAALAALPLSAQAYSGHGGGGFHGAGGYRGGGYRGYGGYRSGGWGYGLAGLGLGLGVRAYDGAYYDPGYYAYGAYDVDGGYAPPPPPQTYSAPPQPACGHWVWDQPAGRYDWAATACGNPG